MDDTQLKAILEALLFSHHGPLSLEKMQSVFDAELQPSVARLRAVLEQLSVDYATRLVQLIELASGYAVRSKKEYSRWISRLQTEKPSKYSRALLETLAIIAYKQPVTRSDIETIRGVAVTSQLIKTLLEREWIQVVAYKDVPGKPALYCTSKEFLNYFNLKHLHELPLLD